jgi:hypothetical protein
LTTSVTETVGLDVIVADLNGNSVPTASVIAFSVIDRTSDANNCTLVGAPSVTVPNTLSPLAVTAGFKGCRNGDQVIVTVTTPLGFITTRTFGIP